MKNKSNPYNNQKYEKVFCMDCGIELIANQDIRCDDCDRRNALDEIQNNLNGARSPVFSYE